LGLLSRILPRYFGRYVEVIGKLVFLSIELHLSCRNSENFPHILH
jgi:hypothetical protein